MDARQESGKIKVAVLSSASGGGAGIAARRVVTALNCCDGIEADFIDIAVLGEPVPEDAAPRQNMNNGRWSDTHFTVEYPGILRGWLVRLLSTYDVVNVHWASYLIGLAELDELSRAGIPLLFTLHDFYYTTGGCHYPAGCERARRGCAGCPQVDHNRCLSDVVPDNRSLKERIFERTNVVLCAPSSFVVQRALDTGIGTERRSVVLRNPYPPVRECPDRKPVDNLRVALIAESFSERRKGMRTALSALKEANVGIAVDRRWKGLTVDLIGGNTESMGSELTEAGVSYCSHGKLGNHASVVNVLQGCHLLLTCSNEDNWPNVLVESGAYGVIPVVGPGHGCAEFVEVVGVGTVATEYSGEAFGQAILQQATMYMESDAWRLARKVRSVHEPSKVGAQYKAVCERLLTATEVGAL